MAAAEETASPRTSEVSERRTERNGFIPALDGLRGLAILGVLLFHLDFPKCSLGWAGVELFFVISGFLITRILLDTRSDTHYFRNFYCRRALRIFPIYYMVVLTYSTVMFFSGRTVSTLPFYCVYLQTIPQLQSQFKDMPMLGHTWTLAIEEQFYLVWPLAVFLLRSRKALVSILVTMIAAGTTLRFLSLGFRNPFLVDGWIGVQIDALACGALVAVAFRLMDRRTLQRWAWVAFCIGTATLLVLVRAAGPSAFWTPRIWGRLWYSSLVLSAMACAFAGIVALAASGNRWSRWLEFRPLRRWGKISYGIYLYHPFVLLMVNVWLRPVLVGLHLPILMPGLFILINLSLAYTVAWLSWQFIEFPINRLKGRFSTPASKTGEQSELSVSSKIPVGAS